MNRKEAFNLFEEMIELANTELHKFTISQKLDIEQKIDKTLVTNCDRYIDKVLSDYAKSKNLLVISEEGNKINKIVKGGNYITIDPID
jgi:fructose-1,6-bisphosphatase/inositol monophosphatase family enzyme